MTISVIIPTHNRASFLASAIRSVLEQDFEDFELIIVDDGSTDDTESVVRGFRDRRVKFVKSAHSGAAVARNIGVVVASGEYVTFLDSDDTALPGWLSALIDGFERHGADIVCCGLLRVENDVETIELPRPMGPAFDGHVGKFTNGGVFAMRKSVFDEIGGYTPGLTSGQHTELALRLMPQVSGRRWKIHNCMTPLIRILIHDGPRIRGDFEAVYRGTVYALAKHLHLLERDRQLLANYYAVAGVTAARTGRKREAMVNFARSIRANPFRVRSWLRSVLYLTLPTFMARRLGRRQQG